MAVVADFQIVHGVGTGVLIGDSGFQPIWEQTFNTGGRHKNGHAYLIFMVRGLTGNGPGARVELNENLIGHIERYPGGNPSHWYMQTINISGGALKNGDNELEVHGAANQSGGDRFDDFTLKNIICHFQQKA